MSWKVVSKLCIRDIFTCSCQGKLFQSCGIRISLRVHAKESVFKMQNTHNTICLCQEKLFESCGVLIFFRLHLKKKNAVSSCGILISLYVHAKKSV